MKQDYEAVNIICPFFQNLKGTKITCEAPYDGCSCVSLVHNSRLECMKQVKIFCQNKYHNCEVYRMIENAKYEI